MCLNPCCSGRWSRTGLVSMCQTIEYIVLILVVVEDGFVLVDDKLVKTNSFSVLILVVVEDGLVLICSIDYIVDTIFVLILVVVEDGLVPTIKK